MAANNNPRRGSKEILFCIEKSCCKSHELKYMVNHAIDSTNPMSPIRLYRIAWSAAVFASARPYHHPIKRNDMIPTPSQPMKS